MSFEIGAQIGPYSIVEQIGQGGMATVFKGYHEALDRYVAIKALNPVFLDDPSFLKRFQREAIVVARLEHPNIVPIYDFSEHNGRPYLVMKLIDGETLKDRMNRGKLSSEEILKVIGCVGSALSYAHQLNILHRDIKPSNVILANDGQIYLADFGLARLVQDGESTFSSDRLLGTPKYISPEQAMSKPDIDARADIYSLGAMVYELVLGRVPFLADTPFTIIHDHIYTPLPSPKSINPNISEDMNFLLTKALEKRPEDRWQSVDIFVKELTRILNDPLHEIIKTTEPRLDDEGSGVRTIDLNIGSVKPTPVSVSEPQPVTKKKINIKQPKSCLWIVLGIIGIVVLTFACLAAFGGLLERFDPHLIVEHPDNALYQDADKVLDHAYEAFDSEEFSKMITYLGEVNQIVGNEPDYYFDSIRQLENQEEYLFAAIVGLTYFKDRPLEEIDSQNLQKLHELIYKAAFDDERMELLFDNEARFDIIGNVARLRYRLYQDEDPFEIKKELSELLNSPILSRRFPEARLLEIEVFIMIGDDIAVHDLSNNLLSEPQGVIPEWIIMELNRILAGSVN